MSRSGFSATSGSRLFISIRSAASWCQPLQLLSLPRGARTTRRLVIVENSFPDSSGHASDIGRQRTIGLNCRGKFADAFVRLFHPHTTFERPAKFEALGAREELNGEQMFCVLHDAAQL